MKEPMSEDELLEIASQIFPDSTNATRPTEGVTIASMAAGRHLAPRPRGNAVPAILEILDPWKGTLRGHLDPTGDRLTGDNSLTQSMADAYNSRIEVEDEGYDPVVAMEWWDGYNNGYYLVRREPTDEERALVRDTLKQTGPLTKVLQAALGPDVAQYVVIEWGREGEDGSVTFKLRPNLF